MRCLDKNWGDTMEKEQLFQTITENIEDLEIIENEMAMIELAIYRKSIEVVKEQKLQEIKEFFEQQAKYYYQKADKYQIEIDKNIKMYERQIEKLMNAYDKLYITTFKIMQSAINNQKIAIANIVTLVAEKENKDVSSTIIALAQKKLNYAVIVDECRERLKWCRENAQRDINEVFRHHVHQLQIYEESIIDKLRRFVFNRISGKSKYRKFLENYQMEYIKDIKRKNNEKILVVMATLKGIIKQMEKVKMQITIEYEQMKVQ